MQRSPVTQIVIFLTLLCVCSQAFPLLGRPSNLKQNSQTERTERTEHDVKLNRPNDDGWQDRRRDDEHGIDEFVAFYSRTIPKFLSKHQSSNDKLINNVEPIDQPTSIPSIWDASAPHQAPLALQASDTLLPTPQAKITTTPPASPSSQSSSSGQRNAHPNLRLATSTEAAENELFQTNNVAQRFFRQRDRSFSLAFPLRAFEAPPSGTSENRPSLSPLDNLHASSLRNTLSHLSHEQYGRSRDTVADQPPSRWLTLPFRRHHGPRVPEHQCSASKSNSFRDALTRWISLGGQGRKSSSAVPNISAVRKPLSERESLFGESIQRSPPVGEPETVFSSERGEQLLLASNKYEYSVSDRASLLERPYLGISWDREERIFKDAKELLSKVSNHLLSFVPTTVDGVPVSGRVTSAQAPPWTQAHSILLAQERKAEFMLRQRATFFRGLHTLLMKPAIRPTSPYSLRLPALTGTIHMTSPSQQLNIPISFDLTPQSCSHLSLSLTECECLAQDIADQILETYIPISSKDTTISRTISTDVNGLEYRATLDLSISSENGGVNKIELQNVLGLLLSTSKQLSHTSSTTFSAITISGEINNISFNATWSFNQLVGGISPVCS